MPRNLLGPILILLALAAPAARADEIDTLEQRLTAMYLNQGSPEQAGEHLKAQNPDGSWPDIDYQDTNSRGGWVVADHLDRMYGMTTAYLREDSKLKDDQRLLEGIVKGINWRIQFRSATPGFEDEASRVVG